VIYLLITGYFFWLVIIFSRVLRSCLPRPSDVVVLSLFFYNVPLALAAYLADWKALGDYMIFLNAVSRDREIADSAMILAILSSASVAVGRWISRPRSSRFEWSFPASARLQSVCALFCVASLAAVTLGILLFGVDTFFAGYAVESSSSLSTEGTALIFFAYEVIGICSFIWVFSRLLTGHNNGRLWIALALGALIMITAMRGKRLELIIALLPLLLLAWSSVLFNPLRRTFILIISVLVISAFASFRQGELPSVESLLFNTFSEGLYAGHVTPGVLEAVQQGSLKTEDGMRYIAAIAAFVPRFIFPDKDAVIYGSLSDIGQFAPLGATSLLAEAYLQGGTLAAAVWFLIVGFLAGRLEAPSIQREGRRIPLKLLFYVIFISSFVLHFRDGLIPAIKIPLQLLVVSAIVVGVAGGRVRRIRTVQHYPPEPSVTNICIKNVI